MKKIGIFGGTFNPIHIAHTTIAANFVEQLDLDVCFFVPTYISPFRQNEANQASAEDRLAMVKLAIAGNSKFQIDEFEIEQKGISYTINTILYFKAKYPDAIIYLLIGGDQAEHFDNWYNWQEILYHAKLCIAQRPLVDYSNNSIFMKLAINSEMPICIDTPLMEISSTQIKEKIKQSESTKGLLAKEVAEYIKERGIYL